MHEISVLDVFCRYGNGRAQGQAFFIEQIEIRTDRAIPQANATGNIANPLTSRFMLSTAASGCEEHSKPSHTAFMGLNVAGWINLGP
jgi:hypothetical protein